VAGAMSSSRRPLLAIVLAGHSVGEVVLNRRSAPRSADIACRYVFALFGLRRPPRAIRETSPAT
jgi:hypothetical protein